MRFRRSPENIFAGGSVPFFFAEVGSIGGSMSAGYFFFGSSLI
jgi:hypothetical protein